MAEAEQKSIAKHYEQALKGRKKFQRFYTLDRAAAIPERDDRTVDVIFSSDAAVEMWFGTETLLHGESNVDLDYFNAKMSPLLIDHLRSSDAQVGVIESAHVSEGKGYARVRFGEGVKADEYYKDVLTGIRSCLSVGYEVWQWEVNEEDKKNPAYTATRWTPREISLVTFPADDSVGVIRSERKDFMFELEVESKNEEDKEMLTREDLNVDPEDEEAAALEAPPPVDGQREPPPATPPDGNDGNGDSENEPVRTVNIDPGKTPVSIESVSATDAALIFKMCRDLKQPDERAYRAIQEKKTFAAFATELTAELTNARLGEDGTVEIEENALYDGLDVELKDVKAFRMTELIAGKVLNPDKFGGFEREICAAEAEKRSAAGIKTEGFAIPGSIVSHSARYHQQRALTRIMAHKDIQQRTTLTAGTDATAGHLIDSELRPENLVEWLYGEFAVSLAATWLMNAKGNIVIPKQDGRTVASWSSETAAATESNPTFSVLKLSPKELKVITPFTKTFAIQSSLDAENLVRRDIMRGLGEALDTALLYGTGTNGQIKGVNQIAEIKKSSGPKQRIDYGKSTGITYANCLEAVEIIGNANAAGPGLEWITSWAFWKQAMGTAMLTNGSFPIWNDGKICDFTAAPTSQVKQGTVGSVANADHGWLGNWMYLMVAMWGGMDIVVDPFTLADSGMIRVVGFYRVDSAVAHDEAFVLLQRTA